MVTSFKRKSVLEIIDQRSSFNHFFQHIV